MLLCEEYALRKGIVFPYARRSSITYAFFGDEGRRIAIGWNSNMPRPGFFEISEYKLGSYAPVSSEEVQWEDFHSRMIKWTLENGDVVCDSEKILNLVFRHFLMINDKALSELFNPLRVYRAMDSAADIIEFTEGIAETSPTLYNFWRAKCLNILTNYGLWLAELQKNNKATWKQN